MNPIRFIPVFILLAVSVTAYAQPSDRYFRAPDEVDFIRKYKEARNSDYIILRNGSRYSGSWNGGIVTVRASYGTFRINLQDIEGVEFGRDPNDPAVVTTIHPSRITGYIEDSRIDFQQDGRGPERLWQEEIAEITVKSKKRPRMSGDRQGVLLTNGDFLTGTVFNGNFIAGRRDSAFPINLSDVDEMHFFGRGNADLMVYERNGDRTRAQCRVDTVRVMADVGGSVELHVNRIKAITGSVPRWNEPVSDGGFDNGVGSYPIPGPRFRGLEGRWEGEIIQTNGKRLHYTWEFFYDRDKNHVYGTYEAQRGNDRERRKFNGYIKDETVYVKDDEGRYFWMAFERGALKGDISQRGYRTNSYGSYLLERVNR